MRGFALTLAVFVCAGCGGGDGSRAVITTAAGEVAVDVEIADDEDERARGLMGRTELDPDAGMIFLFQDEVRGAFWMKNTFVPLSIAFYDAAGRIVRILDMAPCRTEACPLYDPDVAYRGALEVNRGAFDRWGVRVGDRLRLER